MLKGYSLLECICLSLCAPNAIQKQLTICAVHLTKWIYSISKLKCLLVGNAMCFI